MLKKVISSLFLVLIATSLYSASMDLSAKANPTSISLSWSEVSGTVYYDIYKDNGFVARLDAKTLDSLEYDIEKLLSNTEYSISIASRDSQNNTLASARIKVSTDSWNGIYKWENKTDDDNDGKVREITISVETKQDSTYGQYYIMTCIEPDGNSYRMFPLFAFDDQNAFVWHKYKENSVAGNSYRTNAELFNTSSFKPGKWKVYSIVIDSNSTTAYIQTSALGMEFLTTTVYEFSLDESGAKYLSLNTWGEQNIVDNYLFKNPNPGEGDAFILKKIN